MCARLSFTKTVKGNSPVEEYLDSLTSKQAQKVAWVLQLVETLPLIPKQYFKKLEGTDDIWEVRIDQGGNTFRLLGFFEKGNLVILTNGFTKKSQRTPETEIDIAQQLKAEHISRGRKK